VPATPRLNLIQTTRELAKILEIDYDKHFSYIMYRKSEAANYRTFTIPKRGGGGREIHAPLPGLKHLQNRLLPLLQEIYEAPPCAMGHVKERSIKTNAQVHVRRRYILNVDLLGFYDAIHFTRIRGILQSGRYGLSPQLSTAIAQIACFQGKLATGAPTSGILSNIVSAPLDAKLLRFAKTNKLRYSRYVDDITLSSNSRQSIDRCLGESSNGKHFMKGGGILGIEIQNLIEAAGFNINRDKVFFASKSARQQVTGIVVNERLNVPRALKDSVRGALHAIEVHGLERAQEAYSRQHKKSANAAHSLVERLRGQLLYIGQITGQNAMYRRLAQRANSAIPTLGAPVGVSDAELATVVAELEDVQATAFHVGNGVYVSAAHAFPEGSTVMFRSADGAIQFSGGEIDRDDMWDFSVFRCDAAAARTLPALPLSQRRSETGDQVRVVGYPNHAIGNSVAVVETSVTGHSTRMGRRRLDVAHRLEHGASGGPVLSKSGRVIGLVHGGPAAEDDTPVANSVTPVARFALQLMLHVAHHSPLQTASQSG
jgi:RNA-directed DNA polymerase